MRQAHELIQQLEGNVDTEDSIVLNVYDAVALDHNQDLGQTSSSLNQTLCLTSRSQAKRLMARAGKFKVVILDFEHIERVGQAFSDEVFRVFKNRHPDIELFAINTNEEINSMILRAGGKRGETIR